MRSKQTPAHEQDRYSDLMILRSNAGFYVGTYYNEKDDDGEIVWSEPGTRDSEYFPTKEDAEEYLQQVESATDEVAATMLRNSP